MEISLITHTYSVCSQRTNTGNFAAHQCRTPQGRVYQGRIPFCDFTYRCDTDDEDCLFMYTLPKYLYRDGLCEDASATRCPLRVDKMSPSPQRADRSTLRGARYVTAKIVRSTTLASSPETPRRLALRRVLSLLRVKDQITSGHWTAR